MAAADARGLERWTARPQCPGLAAGSLACGFGKLLLWAWWFAARRWKARVSRHDASSGAHRV
jgi:hypothetical protein